MTKLVKRSQKKAPPKQGFKVSLLSNRSNFQNRTFEHPKQYVRPCETPGTPGRSLVRIGVGRDDRAGNWQQIAAPRCVSL